jgi:hypothetical protein
MATEEKKGNGEEKKEEEIKKSSGFRWRVSLSIIVGTVWFVFLILWFARYASDYTVYQNIASVLVSILIMGAILGASWASWEYCWKGQKEREWWQLKRIWFGFIIIIFVIAFGIAQPSLWYLFDKNPPNTVIETSNLLLIVITLLAVGLTGFSVLIYESLQERLKVRVTEVEKEALSHIEEDVEKATKKTEIHQNVFRAQMLRSLGYNYWQLFLVWEEIKVKNKRPEEIEIHTKKIYNDLIKLAIEKAKISLDFAEELPQIKKYKEDIYKCRTNWMYFLAESVRVKGFEQDIPDKKQALKFSDEILEEVGKVDYLEYYYEYQESCAWALQHLSEDKDKYSKKRAHDIIHKLITDRNIRPSWREEIRIKWKNSWTQQGQKFHEDFNKKIEGA